MEKKHTCKILPFHYAFACENTRTHIIFDTNVVVGSTDANRSRQRATQNQWPEEQKLKPIGEKEAGSLVCFVGFMQNVFRQFARPSHSCVRMETAHTRVTNTSILCNGEYAKNVCNIGTKSP